MRKLGLVGGISWGSTIVRHVGQIMIRKGDQELAQINDVQITCSQQAPRALTCQHQLGQELLTVAVQLRESNSLIQYDCNAHYGSTAVPCQAYETIYTGGGLATPTVIISEELPLTKSELSDLGFRYKWYSPDNLEFWLVNGYNLLFLLLTFGFVIWWWNRLESQPTPRRTIATMAATVPVSLALFFSKIGVMLSLYLVD